MPALFRPGALMPPAAARRPDRCPAPGAGRTCPGREDPLAGPAAGAGRPARRPGAATRGSPVTWASARTQCASGGAGSLPAAWKGWRTCPGPGGRGGSPGMTGRRWSRWPASCPRSPGCRSRAGPARSWGANWRTVPWSRAPMSVSSLLRILAEDPVKPWRYQSWIFPRDPDFEAKARVILDLYQGFYGGEPLRPGDRILSFDAKPSIQARERIHATLPAAAGRPVRVEHEYARHGALALLAGFDVHTGKVFASTPRATGIDPFTDLACEVMTPPEYKDAPRVFVVVDNGSDHRGKKAAARLRKAHPNAVMIHTPVHASWLNQVEIFFSVIQKKVVSPNDFPSLEKLSGTLLAFIDRYNQTAKPFSWKYTADDLKDLLRRITEHEKQDTGQQPELAVAA